MILSALRICIGLPRETERFGRTALQRETIGWASGRDHLAGEDNPFPKFHSLRSLCSLWLANSSFWFIFGLCWSTRERYNRGEKRWRRSVLGRGNRNARGPGIRPSRAKPTLSGARAAARRVQKTNVRLHPRAMPGAKRNRSSPK